MSTAKSTKIQMKEIQLHAIAARAAGHKVSGGSNGGGWMRLAISCGYSDDGSKEGAKKFLRSKISPSYSGAPETIKPITAKQPTEASVRRFVMVSRVNPCSDDFLTSFEWRSTRMMALRKHGAICQCCGASPKTGAVINVDHIKPRKLFPELALDLGNLQVLCSDCNHGKGNWDQTDWRGVTTTDTLLQQAT